MDPYKILIVEDDSNNCELIKINLLSKLYAITCIVNGTEALAKLTKENPDLVLLDILISKPDDGWELYRAIRSNPDLKHTRVIILTALDFSPEFLRAKNVLATDLVMKKPFDIDELRMHVKDLLAEG